MKTFILIAFLCSSFPVLSQNYEHFIETAQVEYTENKFKEAVDSFKEAFREKDSSNPYDYYYASMSAIKNGQRNLALHWLQKATSLGLGNQENEIQYIIAQEEFIGLHDTIQWKEIVSQMKSNFREAKAKREKKSERWIEMLLENRPKASSFQLLFKTVQEAELPYFIYYPKQYHKESKLPLIVYLHGGVGEKHFFETYADPVIENEPIFQVADRLNAIVIYPIAKEDFNWLTSSEPLKIVNKIVKEEKENLNIDEKNILLGGMSNGGKATYWFTQQSENNYSAYYSISAIPELEYTDIDLRKIDKKLVSINAIDDELFSFDQLEKKFQKEEVSNANIQLIRVDHGGHGFIYAEQGTELLVKELSKLINEK